MWLSPARSGSRASARPSIASLATRPASSSPPSSRRRNRRPAPTDVARPHRRISCRLCLRPLHLPVAVHEVDDGRPYWENVHKSFLPEFISMNFMMAGMAPVMSFLMMGRDMRAMEPTELLFWGVMSIGVIAGFALAYPVNVWMVKRNLKHGLMTERAPGSRFDLQHAHSGHGQ